MALSHGGSFHDSSRFWRNCRSTSVFQMARIIPLLLHKLGFVYRKRKNNNWAFYEMTLYVPLCNSWNNETFQTGPPYTLTRPVSMKVIQHRRSWWILWQWGTKKHMREADFLQELWTSTVDLAGDFYSLYRFHCKVSGEESSCLWGHRSKRISVEHGFHSFWKDEKYACLQFAGKQSYCYAQCIPTIAATRLTIQEASEESHNSKNGFNQSWFNIHQAWSSASCGVLQRYSEQNFQSMSEMTMLLSKSTKFWDFYPSTVTWTLLRWFHPKGLLQSTRQHKNWLMYDGC